MPKQDDYDHLPIGDALRKMADHHHGALRRHITGDEHDLLNEAADLLDEAAPYHFAFTLQVAKATPFPPDDLDLQVGERIRDLQVGERIRQIRQEKHLSLQDVEARSAAEFKASVLGAYERGERAISMARLQRLALFYDVPLDHLWSVADDDTLTSGDGGAAQRKDVSGRQVGERIRLIRRGQGLSLQEVESLSGGEFKASILGAYERGERAISVARLQRLALFYKVPVDHLWPVADDDTLASGDRGAAVRDTEGPASTKKELVIEIAQLIGVEPPQVSTGSTVTKEIFLSVNERLGLGLDSENLSKPALARAIVEALDKDWLPHYQARGDTVTRSGLDAVRDAVRDAVDPR